MINSFVKYTVIFWFYYIVSGATLLMCFVAIGAWEINVPEGYDEWRGIEKAVYILWAIIYFPVGFVKDMLGIE